MFCICVTYRSPHVVSEDTTGVGLVLGMKELGAFALIRSEEPIDRRWNRDNIVKRQRTNCTLLRSSRKSWTNRRDRRVQTKRRRGHRALLVRRLYARVDRCL